jgi:predicted glutamine amidotransferase
MLARRFPRASQNAKLIDKDRLVAVHASSSAPPPVDDMLARYRDPDRAPVDHRDRYFRLRYRVGNNAVVIASTGLTGTDWRPVPENSLLVVDRRDAAIDQVPLRTCMQEPAR